MLGIRKLRIRLAELDFPHDEWFSLFKTQGNKNRRNSSDDEFLP